MNLNEFLSLLRQPGMSFIDAIETKEFQLILEKLLFSYNVGWRSAMEIALRALGSLARPR